MISPHQEATFRLQILKVQLGLDHVPTWDKVSTYLRHLAAECELLSVGAAAEGTSESSRKHKVNQVGVPQDVPPGKAPPALPPSQLASTQQQQQQPPHNPTATNKGDKGGKGKDGKGKGKDKGGKGGKTCRFWSMPKGCRTGATCADHHPWLPPGENRCYNCGSTEHRRRGVSVSRQGEC